MTIAPVLPSISKNSLNLPILVGHQPNHLWVARLLGWSECYAEGTTREAAIAALETKLTHQLADMEVVNLQVPLPQSNPNLAFAGMFVDDPDADEVIAAIAAYREELDAEEAERDSRDKCGAEHRAYPQSGQGFDAVLLRGCRGDENEAESGQILPSAALPGLSVAA
jgi:hypothetical protein